MILILDENYRIESDSTQFALCRKVVPKKDEAKEEQKEPRYIAVSYNNDLELALKSYVRYTSKDIVKESKDIKQIVDKLEEIKKTIENIGKLDKINYGFSTEEEEADSWMNNKPIGRRKEEI